MTTNPTGHLISGRDQIRAGRVLHFVDAEGLCDMCVERWPCPTEVALGGGSSD